MATEERMTIEERYKYLRLLHGRYWAGSRKERGVLLDEMEEVTGMHRKSLIRLLRSGVERKHRRRQRGRNYGAEVDDALCVISDGMDHICAERLQPNLVWIAEHLAVHGELVVNKRLLEQLGKFSVSTVRRILQRVGQDDTHANVNHLLLFRDGIPLIESLTNLDQISRPRVQVYALVVPVKQLDAFPLRVIAVED